MNGITYSIKKNRLSKAQLTGMELREDGSIGLLENTSIHYMVLPVFDSAQMDASWSRLYFEPELTETMALYVYLFAGNEEDFVVNGKKRFYEEYLLDGSVSFEEKKHYFNAWQGKRFIGKNDILLNELSGRYLYIMVEIIGTGEAALRNLRVERDADTFNDAFPEVYQANRGFFHRFISIFASIYNDFDREIDELPELLDLDKCPKECLISYAGWLGIDVNGDFLSEEKLRTLVKEAYHLNRIKGTKTCIERLVEILLGEKPLILEQNMIRAYEEKGNALGDAFVKNSIYDVNILVRTRLSETERFQLLYLIDQFKPIRARIHLVQLREGGILDANAYLDLNAEVEGVNQAALDDSKDLTENIVLL